MEAVAVAFSMAWVEAGVETGADRDRALGLLTAFRGELYQCLTGRADALFELADAVLCGDGPVRMLACGCRQPMPLGDIHESRLRRGRAAARGSGPGR